ncbi:chitotriosidase-1-like [Antedon mediterranea]|uniref:chitotriosidase-1-like n=1 Tax=Antedon mediterranea TaxID=105859 RepID=UPI003AF5E1AD
MRAFIFVAVLCFTFADGGGDGDSFKCEQDGLFADSHDCSYYYECNGGRMWHRSCAPGTVFNPNIGVCDHAYNVPGCS